MRGHLTGFRRILSLLAAGAMLLATAASPVTAAGNAYVQTNLVSDIAGLARSTDPNLINPWGMSATPQSPIWVSNNHTDRTTLYQGALNGGPLPPVGLVVKIPDGAPTGQVYNPTQSWVVKSGKASAPALFIFASEAGSITGWNAAVPRPWDHQVVPAAVR